MVYIFLDSYKISFFGARAKAVEVFDLNLYAGDDILMGWTGGHFALCMLRHVTGRRSVNGTAPQWPPDSITDIEMSANTPQRDAVIRVSRNNCCNRGGFHSLSYSLCTTKNTHKHTCTHTHLNFVTKMRVKYRWKGCNYFNIFTLH